MSGHGAWRHYPGAGVWPGEGQGGAAETDGHRTPLVWQVMPRGSDCTLEVTRNRQRCIGRGETAWERISGLDILPG